MSFRRLREISAKDKELIIEELKSILHPHGEIIFALIYGSLVTPGIARQYGDMDIALYVDSHSIRRAEYVLESRIEAEIYRALTLRGLNFPPPEVLIINKAPNHFLVKMFKGNFIILKGEEGPITDFIENVGNKSTDNFYFRMESLRELMEG